MASKSAAALLVSETNLARGSVSPSRSHSRAFRGTAQTALASRSHSRAFRGTAQTALAETALVKFQKLHHPATSDPTCSAAGPMRDPL